MSVGSTGFIYALYYADIFFNPNQDQPRHRRVWYPLLRRFDEDLRYWARGSGEGWLRHPVCRMPATHIHGRPGCDPGTAAGLWR